MSAEFLVIAKDGRFSGGMRGGVDLWVLGIEKAQHFHIPRAADRLVEFLEGAEIKVVRAEYTVL